MVYLMIIVAFLYGLSFILLMLEILKRNYKYGTVAYRVLLIGGIFQAIIFIVSMVQRDIFLLLTLYDVLFFYSLILMTISLLIYYLFNWKLLEITTIFISFITLVGAISVGETSPLINQAFLSKLLFIHILLSIISYTAFSLSFIFSLLYFLHDYLLKRKIWNGLTKALSSLESLERNAFFSNIIGSILLFAGLIIGSNWASLFFGWSFFLDPKVLVSYIVLGMYGLSIIKRQQKAWTNKQVAYWNIISFITVILNLAITQFFFSFHRWL